MFFKDKVDDCVNFLLLLLIISKSKLSGSLSSLCLLIDFLAYFLRNFLKGGSKGSGR